jgi:hypothetical protein
MFVKLVVLTIIIDDDQEVVTFFLESGDVSSKSGSELFRFKIY